MSLDGELGVMTARFVHESSQISRP